MDVVIAYDEAAGFLKNPPSVELSCACRRHVGDMSPTADNVGKILPTGPVGDIDIFFFVPAQKNVGKCRHFIVVPQSIVP